ncbi:hypothetical protein [Risungbinella massiliensis]|uniref:hypothetical protein n=1 Tax=Risungbinella massiliensis TaxID=1329796 RepID=UPI0005CBE5AE|nr:hypothetical protein [Risungbinella massiliensis]
MKRFIKRYLGMANQNLDNITLPNLEQKMRQEQFDENVIQEILTLFQKRIDTDGQAEFQTWLCNLHYRLPEEFQNEIVATQIYDKCLNWIEQEVKKLKNETKLTWEEQTEDIQSLSFKARKAQLVIRHRLSEVVFDLCS